MNLNLQSTVTIAIRSFPSIHKHNRAPTKPIRMTKHIIQPVFSLELAHNEHRVAEYPVDKETNMQIYQHIQQ